MGTGYYLVCDDCEFQISIDERSTLVGRPTNIMRFFSMKHSGHKISVVPEYTIKHEYYYYDELEPNAASINKYIFESRYETCHICERKIDLLHDEAFTQTIPKKLDNGAVTIVCAIECKNCYKPEPILPFNQEYEDMQVKYWLKKLKEEKKVSNVEMKT